MATYRAILSHTSVLGWLFPLRSWHIENGQNYSASNQSHWFFESVLKISSKFWKIKVFIYTYMCIHIKYSYIYIYIYIYVDIEIHLIIDQVQEEYINRRITKHRVPYHNIHILMEIFTWGCKGFCSRKLKIPKLVSHPAIELFWMFFSHHMELVSYLCILKKDWSTYRVMVIIIRHHLFKTSTITKFKPYPVWDGFAFQ